MHGIPLKENTVSEVPTTPVTVMPADADSALPAKLMHATDVAVVQLLVEQSAVATAAVTVVSEGAKFMPVNVTLAVTETAL